MSNYDRLGKGGLGSGKRGHTTPKKQTYHTVPVRAELDNHEKNIRFKLTPEKSYKGISTNPIWTEFEIEKKRDGNGWRSTWRVRDGVTESGRYREVSESGQVESSTWDGAVSKLAQESYDAHGRIKPGHIIGKRRLGPNEAVDSSGKVFTSKSTLKNEVLDIVSKGGKGSGIRGHKTTPKEPDHIKKQKMYGQEILKWHGGQFSPTYAVGSMLATGRAEKLSRSQIGEAINELHQSDPQKTAHLRDMLELTANHTDFEPREEKDPQRMADFRDEWDVPPSQGLRVWEVSAREFMQAAEQPKPDILLSSDNTTIHNGHTERDFPTFYMGRKVNYPTTR